MLSKKDLATIQFELSTFDKVREDILDLSREATRLSGQSIMKIHRGELKSAAESLENVKSRLERIDELSKSFSDLRSTGGVIVAHQEFVEASTLWSYVDSGKIPSMKDLGSGSKSYMLGLLDLIGEFRRMSLNSLRNGDVDKSGAILDAMEGIYDDLQSLDHTAIVPTFRVKMDAARRIIETTRGDVVTELRRYSLERALTSLEKRLTARSRLA